MSGYLSNEWQNSFKKLSGQIEKLQGKLNKFHHIIVRLKASEKKYNEKETAVIKSNYLLQMSELSGAYIAKMEKLSSEKAEVLNHIEEAKSEYTVLLSNLPFG